MLPELNEFGARSWVQSFPLPLPISLTQPRLFLKLNSSRSLLRLQKGTAAHSPTTRVYNANARVSDEARRAPTPE